MLKGRTALIVEEEFLIALDIQRMLENAGAGQTLFARTAAEATLLCTNRSDIAVAVIELRRHDAATRELLESLRAATIPIVLITSDAALPQAPGLFQVSDLALVIKPVPEDALANALRQALRQQS